MRRPPNYYSVLGIKRKANAEAIRRAYHLAVRELHPDVNNDPAATELFLKAQEAYEILSDPVRRAAYDAEWVIATQPPVTLNTLFSRTHLLQIQEPQLYYALLEIKPEAKAVKKLGARPSPPLNVCLLIDRSTSMGGERLDTVKATAIEILRQLRDEDLLSIVTFSDKAQILAPARRTRDVANIEGQIRSLRNGGGTEIFKGLEAAVVEVRRHLKREQVNHIILLTDGRTYGDEKDCLSLASKAADSGIGISGFGIGTDWNDTFLDDLAVPSGNQSQYISNAKDIQNFLQKKFYDLGQVFAEQLMFEFQPNQGVALQYAFRLDPDPGPLPVQTPIRLGNIPLKSKLSFILEFMVDPLETETEEQYLLDGSIQMNIPALAETPPLEVLLSTPVHGTDSDEEPPLELMDAISRVTLYRMQERARQEVAEGQIESAHKRLQLLATQLLAQGKHALANTVLAEARNLMHTHALTRGGEKDIKYGTRALFLPASTGGDPT
ncbi:MAG: VWA domain-containing protein [Anaerolineales bacterium]|jgi:Ca-activated chloride channel family protein